MGSISGSRRTPQASPPQRPREEQLGEHLHAHLGQHLCPHLGAAPVPAFAPVSARLTTPCQQA